MKRHLSVEAKITVKVIDVEPAPEGEPAWSMTTDQRTVEITLDDRLTLDRESTPGAVDGIIDRIGGQIRKAAIA